MKFVHLFSFMGIVQIPSFSSPINRFWSQLIWFVLVFLIVFMGFQLLGQSSSSSCVGLFVRMSYCTVSQAVTFFLLAVFLNDNDGTVDMLVLELPDSCISPLAALPL